MSELKSNVAVIGEFDNVAGFAAVGFESFPVATEKQAVDRLRELVDSGAFAIIYITEDIAERIASVIAEYSDRATPAIVPIPGASGATGYASRKIKNAIVRAVGIDLELKK